MRTRYRYDADLDSLVEIGGNSNYFEPEKPRSANVISDDVGAGVNGLRVMHRMDGRRTDSKSAYRRDVKEAGLAEVGTSADFASKRERPGADDYGRMVRDARDQISGDWQGTRAWLEKQNEGRGR